MSKDTYVCVGRDQSRNFGNERVMYCGVSSAQGCTYYVYLRHYLSGAVPPGDTVERAVLRLWVESVSASGMLRVYQLNRDWDEQTVTGNYQMGMHPSPESAFSISSAHAGTYIDIDITEHYRVWHTGTGTIPKRVCYGLRIQSDTALVGFATRESLESAKEPQVIVTHSAGQGPVLSVTPLSLDFGTTQTELWLTVRNTGTGTLNWSVTKVVNNSPWLGVSPTSGERGAGQSQQVRVTVGRMGLRYDVFTDTLRFTSNGGNQNVPVRMERREEHGSLRVTLEPAGARTAGAQWRLTWGPDREWKDSGVTITVPVGSYTITFKDVSGWAKPRDQEVQIVANTTVSKEGLYTRPVLSVTPVSLDFGTTQTELWLTVKNEGTGTLNWSVTKANDSPWLGVSPTSGERGAGQSQQVRVTVGRMGLIYGTHTDTLRFTSNGGNQNVPVRMVREDEGEAELDFRDVSSLVLGSVVHVSGTIVSARTGTPVSGVRVYVHDTIGWKCDYADPTDDNGRFSYTTRPPSGRALREMQILTLSVDERSGTTVAVQGPVPPRFAASLDHIGTHEFTIEFDELRLPEDCEAFRVYMNPQRETVNPQRWERGRELAAEFFREQRERELMWGKAIIYGIGCAGGYVGSVYCGPAFLLCAKVTTVVCSRAVFSLAQATLTSFIDALHTVGALDEDSWKTSVEGTRYAFEIAAIGHGAATADSVIAYGLLFVDASRIESRELAVSRAETLPGDGNVLWVSFTEGTEVLVHRESSVQPPQQPEHVYEAASGWYLVSVPTNGDTADIFGTRLHRWDPSRGAYVIPTSLSPNAGYWAQLPASKRVTAVGTVPTGDQTVALGSAGWHMISAPWPYPKGAIQVTRGGETKSWADAVAAGWVANPVYSYKPGDGAYTAPTTLHPWYGYWLHARVSGLTLRLAYASRIAALGLVDDVPESAVPLWATPGDMPPPPPSPGGVIGAIQFANVPNPITDVYTTTFRVFGPMAPLTTEIRVAVYDLSGRLVWQGSAAGAELVWHTDDLAGRYLANGVYIYQATARVAGVNVVSGLLKLSIMR